MAMHAVGDRRWGRQAELADLPDPGKPAGPERRSARLGQLLAWIDQHLHEDIGWERLMRISGMSPTQLQQLFQRELKTTPMTYIRIRRRKAGRG